MDTLVNLLTLAAALGVTVYSHRQVSIERARVVAELRQAANLAPLGLFDLSRGDVQKTRATRRLVEPERLWTYDAEYLTAFATAVGKPVLGDVYVRRVLLGWDRVFALGLALTAFLVDFLLAWLLEGVPVVWHVLVFAAGMSLLYGVADLAEDSKLAAIFLNDRGVDRGEAAAAHALTRIKITAVVLSVAGILIFMALQRLQTLPRSTGTAQDGGKALELA